MTIQCTGVISDAVLQAARNAIPMNWPRWITLPPSGRKNAPLLPLIVSLLDAVQATADAILDNAQDDYEPIDPQLASDLLAQLAEINQSISAAGRL